VEYVLTPANIVLKRQEHSSASAYTAFHSYCSDVEETDGLICVETRDLRDFMETFSKSFSDGSGDCQNFKILQIHVI